MGNICCHPDTLDFDGEGNHNNEVILLSATNIE